MSQDYLQDFVREAKEQITELNNALLALESDPDDREAMDQIFRIAHTLKGNAGAMGFDGVSNLAHAVEDLLDEIREGHLQVTPDRMDLIFAGVDTIEAILGEIEDQGEATSDPSDLVEEIRTAITNSSETSNGPESTANADVAVRQPSFDSVLESIENVAPFTDGEERLFHAAIDLDDSQMPSVDAMILLESIEEEASFSLVTTDPARDAVENGDFDGSFDLFVASSDDDRTTLETVLDDTGGTDAISDVTDSIIQAESATDHEPGSADTSPGSKFSEDGPDAGDSADTNTGNEPNEREVKSVRVDVDQLDELHGLVEQLVTSRIKLRRAVEEDDHDGAMANLDELDKITSSLQNTVMDMQLIPLKKVVGKFPRLVRDVAREVDKEVNFELSGEDVELDRTILTEISDPLMHILRNAVDHGIEAPDVRLEKGKPREGNVSLRAERQRDHVIIEVEDDGAGLDVERIRIKALENGIRTEEELDAMDDTDVYDLIFHPGFSTSEEVTDVSGRGVGMDVVHSTVKRLDGDVSVESEPDEGTLVTLRVPVTVAIVNVLFVEVGGKEYGVPIKTIDAVNNAGDIETINGKDIVEYDEDLYQVIRLGSALDVDGPTLNGDGMLLRIRKSERQVALHCDRVKKQEEVVVKPMEGILSGIEGIGGTAVLGDGQIVPIVDVVTL